MSLSIGRWTIIRGDIGRGVEYEIRYSCCYEFTSKVNTKERCWVGTHVQEQEDWIEARDIQTALINIKELIARAPGIVVGRMQQEGMIEHSMLNNLKEKYEIVV